MSKFFWNMSLSSDRTWYFQRWQSRRRVVLFKGAVRRGAIGFKWGVRLFNNFKTYSDSVTVLRCEKWNQLAEFVFLLSLLRSLSHKCIEQTFAFNSVSLENGVRWSRFDCFLQSYFRWCGDISFVALILFPLSQQF